MTDDSEEVCELWVGVPDLVPDLSDEHERDRVVRVVQIGHLDVVVVDRGKLVGVAQAHLVEADRSDRR